jgi:tRNA A-37 threonylcarbamoyl transferase component Bud32
MDALNKESLQQYLCQLYKTPVEVIQITQIGSKEATDRKRFGYGKPLLVRFIVHGKTETVVLETMAENSFGHDHFSDRAQNLLWANSVYNKMPKHVRSLDVGAITSGGNLLSAGSAEEFFLLTQFAEGETYYKDLERIYRSQKLDEIDEQRAKALALFLTEIHKAKLNAPHIYTRRIRDLIGHGECIMGLIDNYPSDDKIFYNLLQPIEAKCVEWRWKLKGATHRLCQVHGDFHPWNILFREKTDFSVLDRSRGEWGEPADDIASMIINYLFLSLQWSGSFDGPFRSLFYFFWNTYMETTGDLEMSQIIQPFLAWRGLVIANPIWYPALSSEIRLTIFRFIQNVLSSSTFNPEDMNEYLK